MHGGAVWEAKNVSFNFMKVNRDGQLCDKGIILFPKTKKDLVVLSRQCCLFCLLKS